MIVRLTGRQHEVIRFERDYSAAFKSCIFETWFNALDGQR
jgi:hypothetical protein